MPAGFARCQNAPRPDVAIAIAHGLKLFSTARDGMPPIAPYQMQNDGERPRSGKWNDNKRMNDMNPTFKTALGATLLLAMLAGGTAVSAQQRGPQMDFSAADTNADGEISVAEMTAHRAAQFALIDTDGSGTVDAAELLAAGEAREQARKETRAAQMIERADANDDGVLSQDELQAPRPRADMFERMDKDGNGSLSQEELEAASEHMRDRRDNDRGQRDHDRREGHGRRG